MSNIIPDRLPALFVYSEEMGRFDFGPDHPYKPERATKTLDLCMRYGVINYPWMRVVEPQNIDEDLLYLFHEPGYLHLLKDASHGQVSLDMLERGLGTADTPILRGLYDWSVRAAGGTYSSMKDILEGRAQVAFNPLGGFHHARRGNAEGFCYINDIVIALMGALQNKPHVKIAYVDFDAHHGNGVQEAFYEDRRVLFISVHETGRTLYPWSGSETETGHGVAEGYTVNIPLEPGADDEVYSFALDHAVFPILKAFCPDFIVAEIGADTLISDPLTHLKLTNNGYQKALRGLMPICPKILALGGGGYDLYRTSRCWTLAWAILNHVDPVDEFAGLVGGMMFGPEMEVGSLFDHPFLTKGEAKDRALAEVERVVAYIQEKVFPVHRIKPTVK
jgi:acetoin utilization protein AcuC